METAVGDDKVGRFFLHQAMLPLPLSDVIRERNSAHVRKRGRPPLACAYAAASSAEDNMHRKLRECMCKCD